MRKQTFDWCKQKAKILSQWGVKKIILAGNKSDGDYAVDVDEVNEWCEENNYKNFFVCASNNVGTEALFIEMDRLDLEHGGSFYALESMKGTKTEHARELF